MKRFLLLALFPLTCAYAAPAQDNACMGSTEVDPCVVGNWTLARGGPVAWMQGLCGVILDATQLKLEGQGANFDATVTYNAGGSYEASANSFRMLVFDPSGAEDDTTVNLQGEVRPATGRWSVSGDTLNNCQDSGGLDGTIFTTDIDRRPSTSVSGVADITMEYSCSASGLRTSMSMGFITGEVRNALCTFGPLGEFVDGVVNSTIRNPGDDFPMVMEFIRAD